MSAASSAWWARRAGSTPPCARATRENRTMKCPPCARRKRILDRDPRKLVAKADAACVGAKHAGEPCTRRALHPRWARAGRAADARRAAERPRQRRADRRASSPSRAARAKHGIAHRLGDAFAVGGKRLGDEERIPVRPLVQDVGIDARARREIVRRPPAKALHDRHAERAGAELAEQCAQRMNARDFVVAVGRDHECRHRFEPSGDETKDVERRFVRPVNVLDQDDRRPGRELADELGRERVWLRPRGCDLRQLAADSVGDLEERAERARRVQRLAGGPQDAPPTRSDALKESTSAVLPIPASPRTSASFPVRSRRPRQALRRAPRARQCARGARNRTRGWSKSRFSCQSCAWRSKVEVRIEHPNLRDPVDR